MNKTDITFINPPETTLDVDSLWFTVRPIKMRVLPELVKWVEPVFEDMAVRMLSPSLEGRRRSQFDGRQDQRLEAVQRAQQQRYGARWQCGGPAHCRRAVLRGRRRHPAWERDPCVDRLLGGSRRGLERACAGGGV
jgi:hypothetical protein